MLHGLDLADRRRTNSVSQVQPATLLQASNVIQVQPAASMSLADMQQRTCEMASPRSREHLRLPLPGAIHASKELRTVVPCEVMSPHHRLSDPSPLSGSPRDLEAIKEVCSHSTCSAGSTSSSDINAFLRNYCNNYSEGCLHHHDHDYAPESQFSPTGIIALYISYALDILSY